MIMAASMEQIDIWPHVIGAHTLIIGMTGSGKSIMLMEQCRQSPQVPVVIYDTKGDADFLKLGAGGNFCHVVTGIAGFKKAIEAHHKSAYTYIVVTPTEAETMEPELLDEYLIFHYYNLPDSVVAIDELLNFMKNGQSQFGLSALLTRGRSKKQTVIMCTQRPKRISLFCKTQASKIIVYNCHGQDDRIDIEQLSLLPRDFKLDRFYFWVYKIGENNGTLFAPLPLRFTPAQESSQSKFIGKTSYVRY